MERHLGRADHTQAAVLVQVAEGAEGLHHRLAVGLSMIGTGEHHLTGSQLRFHIAHLTLLGAAEVAAGVSPHIAEGPEVLLRMHHNGVILGLGEVQQRLLHLIAHLDAVQGLAGCFGGFRCHDRHRISGAADLPVENQAVIGAGLRIGLSGGGEPALGHILPGIDGFNARYLQGTGKVYFFY